MNNQAPSEQATVKARTWGPFLSLTVGLPLLCVAAVLSIPYGVAMVFWIWQREARLKRRLARSGRLSKWAAISEKLKTGDGTLIVEQANKESQRVWWTPQPLIDLWKGELPKFEQEYITWDRSHPLVPWIVERCLEGATHPAILVTNSPRNYWPPFGEASAAFHAEFPQAKVVFTILTRKISVARSTNGGSLAPKTS